MASEHGERRSGWWGDAVVAIALATFAFANLALPKSAQSIGGVDYLLVVFCAVAVAAFLRFPRMLRRPRAWVFAATLLLVAIPGMIAAPINTYGEQKIQSLIILVAAVLAATTFADTARGATQFVTLGAVTSVVLAAMVFLTGVTTVTGRISLEGLNPIGVARAAAVGAVTLVLWLTAGGIRGPLRRLAVVASAVMCLGATVITGSRGPLLAAMVAVLLGGLLVLKAKGARGAWLAVCALLAALAAVLGFVAPEAGAQWATDRGDSGRLVLYARAVELIRTHPEGVGWGNFAEASGSAVHLYPHNLYLEVGAEGGVIALLAFVLLTLVALHWSATLYLRSRTSTDLLVFGIYVYALVNAQFSSDIVGNRMLWVALAFVCVRGARSARDEVEGRPRNLGGAAHRGRIVRT